MRLPLDLAGPSSSSSISSANAAVAAPLLTRITSSPIGLSALYVAKSLFQQHQFLEKRGASVGTRHQWVVDLVLCILSFIGALTIIVPYILTKQSRKLRHSLILGLATSDLASSSIIIITTSVSLAGGNLTQTVRLCQFAGYFFQVAIWTQNLWNLSIAIITYMILVHPLSSFNARVERYLIWFWPIFWSISFAVNSVGFPVTGFANSGGYCGFSPYKGGAYFSSIFQFVPRAFVVIVIIILYTHLFFFLRRANMFNRATSNRQLSSAGRSRDSHRQRGMVTQEDAELKDSDEALIDHPASAKRNLSMLYRWKRSISQSHVGPPASETPRHGSGSSQGKSSLGAVNHLGEKQELPVLEMDDYAGISPKSKASDMPPSPTSVTHPQPQQMQQVPVPIIKVPPPSLKSPDASAVPGSEPSFRPTIRRGSTAHFDLPEEDSDDDDDDEEGSKKKTDNLHGLLDILQPMAPRRDVRDFGMTSSPREHLKHYSLSPAGLDFFKKAKEGEGPESNDQTLNGMGESGSTEVPSYESMLGQNWTWGMPVGGGGAGEKSSKSHPNTPSRSHFRNWGSRRQSVADRLGTGTNNSSSTDENGVESLGSTLNRQASILLLLYPAAYSILFSISIIRVIVDISNPTGSAADKQQRSTNLLHTIARWTIFAQGAIDALVFQFVERSFRMRMKRKRRIAAGEVVPDFWMDAYYKKVKNFIMRTSQEL